MAEPSIESSPQSKARIAGIFYALTFVFGILSLMSPRGRLVTSLLASAAYVAVTLLFYVVFKPVNQRISLLAALVGLVGCAVGALSALGVDLHVNSLVFFGFYCLLIGHLIWRSTFLPRILGVLMGLGGLGWLTYLSPSLAKSLGPFSMAPGILGEAALTVWILVKGVNAERWKEQARGLKTSRA
jgi:hypothetical protein